MNKDLDLERESEADKLESLPGDGSAIEESKDKSSCSGWRLAALATGALALGYVGVRCYLSNKDDGIVNVIAPNAAAEKDDMFSQYLQFVSKYGKFETNEADFNRRFEVFRANVERIEAHNKLYEQGEAPFDMEVNQFADLTEEEFLAQYASGLKVPEKRSNASIERIQRKVSQQSEQRMLFEQEGIPAFKDWYKEGKVTAPYDQHGCGGCWAFSTASAVESLLAISGRDRELTELSVQQLIDCDKTNYGCDGGWMYEGFEYINQHGILKKSDYHAYSRRQMHCSVSDRELDHLKHAKEIGYIEHDGRTNEELRVLVAKGPVSAGMVTTASLSSYRSGVLTERYLRCSSSKKEVNHGIVIVGYGTVQEHEQVFGRGCRDYWVVRNSWGTNWGQDGFFKLCADDVGSSQTPLGTCLINKYAVWPTMDPSDIDPDY